MKDFPPTNLCHIAASQKRFLIIGGTGSLGTTLTHRLLKEGRTVAVFSRDEAKHFKHKKLFSSYKDYLTNIVGDVRDYDSVYKAIQSFCPDVIIIASAMKQVPLCEEYPEEAVKTNVIGTQNVLRAASNHYTDRTVKILSVSTDKAVKPINAYGSTKALQEKIHLTYNSNTCLIANCVRYGNVLESTGSVIPFFKTLLKEGKNLPITDKSMTRFLLSLDQAVDLIFDALEDETGGRIFIPSVFSCKITDLAIVLSDQFNIERWSNLDYVGIRPGEKLHELLVSEEECRRLSFSEDRRHFIIESEPNSSLGLSEYEFSSDYAGCLFSLPELTAFLIKKGVIPCELESQGLKVF